MPLAFALVESENDDNWSGFMRIILYNVFGPKRKVCIILDWHHGLLQCGNEHIDVFPQLVHRWCMKHFAANVTSLEK